MYYNNKEFATICDRKGYKMEYFILGILVGWLVPRPKLVGKVEAAIWSPIKKRMPESITKHFG